MSCCDDHQIASEDYNLLLQINNEQIRCLNAVNPEQTKSIFRPWHHRFDVEPILVSDADEQLIIHIPLFLFYLDLPAKLNSSLLVF